MKLLISGDFDSKVCCNVYLEVLFVGIIGYTDQNKTRITQYLQPVLTIDVVSDVHPHDRQGEIQICASFL